MSRGLSRRRLSVLLGLGLGLGAAALSGCGSSPVGLPGLDDGGGFALDGGQRDDGGSSTDGGPSSDGGSSTDGGSSSDGGSSRDGGSSTDGGAVLDGGAARDGGSSTDGGTVGRDGGSSGDGGTFPGDGGPPAGTLGAACTGAQCGLAGFCLTERDTTWPGGYCSASCAVTGLCGNGGVCYARYGVCLQGCTPGGADCRPGYTCASRFGTDALPGNSCVPGRADAHVGDPCADATACPPGGFCVQQASGFPGGYCTLGCDAANDLCGAGAACTRLGALDPPTVLCLKSCASDGDCRVPGYVCEASWFGQALPARSCVPGVRAQVPVGGACTTGGDCQPSWLCLGRDAGFPGGYCTRSCGFDTAACPAGAYCDGRLQLCLTRCNGAADCRNGYSCESRFAGGNTQFPTCVAATSSAHVGDPCATFADCLVGGFCVAAQDNGQPTGFTGGYCTDTCGTAQSPACPAGSFCGFSVGSRSCIDACTADADCRQADGYLCRDLGQGRYGCYPSTL